MRRNFKVQKTTANISVGEHGERMIVFTLDGKNYGLAIGPVLFEQLELKGQQLPVVMQLLRKDGPVNE